MTYTVFSARTDKLLWSAGAIVVALLVLRAVSLAIMRLERRSADGERQLVRLRRGETAAALVATAIPYVAAIAVHPSIHRARTRTRSRMSRGTPLREARRIGVSITAART
jgi:hypothetical protein